MAGLAGCTAANSAQPELPGRTPAQWSEVKARPVSQDLSQYWTQLDDPVLTRLVEQAIANNLDMAQAAARLDQARAALKGAQSQYFPQVSGNAGAQKDVGDLARKDVQYSLGGSASWEIDLFGRIGGSVAASRADLAAAGYSLADMQRLVAGQVAQNVISARATAAQLAIARSTLANDAENLQIARWRNEAGLVSSLDVEQARGQRAQSAAAIPQLESNLAATANAISTLIGEPPGRVLALLEEQQPATVPVPPVLAGFAPPAEVLRRRPDVRAAEASLVADSARVGVAKAQLLPLLQLSGQVNTAAPRIGDLFDIVTGGLFATVSQLIFDGGRARANVRGAQAAARGSLAAWHKAILTALADVETAATAEDAARRRLASTREALDAANSAAILARSQYRAGLTDFVTLLNVESRLLSARNAVVQTEAARASAFVQLTQALGGGWTASQYPLLPGKGAANYGNP
ncbi:efflux transporter outer membrane subunit [Novosphingobium beihaiensis]|uniref:Efflux transporter outer membrane subunit n=1 Tax=Novosphingobium beihaiensis TaxID=2930389 RepID=A0ABT0BRI5_9SPHN|nr:efflux transporter outer membrane subunit [Novosphingobium beihaiensis]MCJ2187663.1 efflux transporter outer membrane subunit [Novosphingobium beihaiensis]